MCDCSGSTTLGRLGGSIGDKLQRGAVKRFKNWTGLGDYNIVGNSLINGISSDGEQPSIETRGRSTTIRYREYLGDVTTHPNTVGAFHTTTYEVNPGNPITFPWLSGIALRFEQYKPKGIIFEFRSTATDTTTAASLGSVMMASEYDHRDKIPITKAEMVNSAYSSEAKMTTNLLHGIECDPSELQRSIFYVKALKTTNSAVDPDQDDYQICRTTIATQGGGLAINSSVGSLYVHYEFEFFKEQAGSIAPDLLFARYVSTNSSPVNNFLGSYGMTRRTGQDLGITFDGGIIYFPKHWAGKIIELTFYFVTDAAHVVAAGAADWSYDGCTRVLTFNSPIGIPQAAAFLWNERAPGIVDANTAGNGWTYGKITIKLNPVLAQRAFIQVANPDGYGIWLSGSTGLRTIQLEAKILPENFYEPLTD